MLAWSTWAERRWISLIETLSEKGVGWVRIPGGRIPNEERLRAILLAVPVGLLDDCG